MRVLLLLAWFLFPFSIQAQTYESLEIPWPSSRADRVALHKKVTAAGWACFPYAGILYCHRQVSTPQPSPAPTPAPTPTPSPTPAPLPSPSPTPSGPTVVRFRILDSANTPITELTDGQVIDRSSLPLGSLVFAAVTNPEVVGSVRISVPALNDTHTENGAPYTSILFDAAQLPDQIEISAQAHSEANLGGTAGPPVTITVKIGGGSTPGPTPSPTPSASPTPMPSPAPTPLPPATGALYVSPTGSGVLCTLKEPCSLEKVLSRDPDNPVRPGHLVYLRGGRYFKNDKGVCNASLWCAQVAGTKENPITYQSYPGELATLDTTYLFSARLLTITGDYNVFRDLEFTVSSYWAGPYQAECTDNPASPPYIGPRHQCGNWKQTARGRGNAIDVDGARGVKIINNLIHDAGQGLFAGVRAPELEYYGNIVFYNGGLQSYLEAGAWTRNDGMGHGVYIQNDEGMDLSDNIFFANYNFGIHAYGTNVAPLRNMVIDRNISYSNGIPSGKHNPNLLIGSGLPIIDGKVRDNHMFRPFGGGSNCQFGYYFAAGVLNESATITGNRCIGGDFVAQLTSYKALTFTDNHMVGTGAINLFLNQYDSAIPYRAKYVVDRNRYANPNTQVFVNEQQGKQVWKGDFAGWKARFGWDASSTFSTTLPTQNEILIYPNQYEPGRANIVIYNWSLADKIRLDLSSVLLVGDRFEIRNAERMLANSQQSSGVSQLSSPLVSGVWNGPIEVDVSNLTPSIPVGHTSAPVLHGREFIVLVVQKR